MNAPSKREYRDADRLLQHAIWANSDVQVALLRSWIQDTKPSRRRNNPARWSYFEFAILGAILLVGFALWLLAGMR